MSRLLPLLWLLVLTLSATACTEDFFVDLEPLERELLGVWVAAERADTAVLVDFHAGAQRQWQRTRQRFAGITLSPAERTALRATDLWMAGLDGAVRGQNLPRIRHQLRQLHATVRELRGPVATDHPADLLYTFHEEWGWVSEISHDQMMCLVEWSEFEDAYRAARSTWRRFEGVSPGYHRELFPGYATAAVEAEVSHTALLRELEEFERRLATGNHTLTTQLTEEVERLFFDHLALLIGYPIGEPAL